MRADGVIFGLWQCVICSTAVNLAQRYSKFLKAGPYSVCHQPFEVRKTTIPSKRFNTNDIFIEDKDMHIINMANVQKDHLQLTHQLQ